MADPSVELKTVSPELAITDLGLRTRVRNALLNSGVSTVSDLIALMDKGDDALANIEGVGPSSIEQITMRLTELGLMKSAPAIAAAEASSTLSAPLESIGGAPESPAEAAEKAEVSDTPVVAVAAPASAEPSLGERLRATLAQGGGRLGVLALLVLGVALVIVALFLPPASLLERVGILGYTTVSADASSMSHPDGITVKVDPETFVDQVRIKLDSVPRLDFLEGSAGSGLLKAVEALPDNLAVKSPYYRIESRGKYSGPVTIEVAIPNDSEPWETLDLYTWSGESWEWVGAELDADTAQHEVVRAQVTELPESIVVVQSTAPARQVSVYVDSDDAPVSTAAGAIDESNPIGLLLGTMGGFAGDDTQQLVDPEAVLRVIPTLRNWAPGASINRGLLSEMLTTAELRDDHIANIVQMCVDNALTGIEIDYRGVESGERDAYATFIEALSTAMHAEGLTVNVVLPSPMSENGGLNTAGYDWKRIGAAADVVKVPFPVDPTAYAQGGAAHKLAAWATAEVSRLKLRMMVSSLSAETASETVNAVTLEQALAPFGQVIALSDISQVKPGSELEFSLSGQVQNITPVDAAGTYRLEYTSEDSQTHTVWLGTAANLSTKLQLAQEYHLGGIAVADMLDMGNAPGILDAVNAYRAAAAPIVGSAIDIAWTTTSAAATVDQQISALSAPNYKWMVLVTPGDYTVGASLAGYDHGSITVTVLDTTVDVTEEIPETGEITETAEAGETEDEIAAEAGDDCLDAAYVADVTIPDNTQFEAGEEFEKTWRVRNSGTCAWPEDTVIAFVSDSQMGAPESVEVGALDPGAQTEITVKMVAPAEDGRYSGVWRMKSTDGLFGGQFTVVIQVGETANVPVAVVAPVSGGTFELGGHVRDMGLPYASDMHYAGMTWAKVQVHYGQDASGIVNAAHAQGFKIQLSALGSPDMVTRVGYESDFANWVAGLAASGADAIEVWNEPNIDREWQIGYISPQAYTNLLCTSYNAIKGANPNVAVISAAPAPTGYFGGCSPNGCDDQPWLAGMAAAGAVNCMDYIGAHHNSGATSPSATSGHPANPGSTHHSWFFLPQTSLYYNTFGGARKLFYTEMGYASQEGLAQFSDQFAWARGTNNAQQAQWLAEAVGLSVNTGMVRCIIVWNIDFVRYGYDPQDGYAIIRPGGACPACDSLHAVLGTR